MNGPRFEDPFPVDPELRELLREIEARQEARLLRLPATRPATALLAVEPIIRSADTGLVPAERKLVERYREELAALLRELAVVRLSERRRSKRWVNAYISDDLAAPYPPERMLLEDLERERDHLQQGYGDSRSGVEILDQIRYSTKPAACVEALARAAMRLVPRDICYIYYAADLVASNRLKAASAVIEDLLRRSPNSLVRSHACSWSALLASRRSDWSTALAMSRASRDLEPSLLYATFNCIAYALQHGSAWELNVELQLADGAATGPTLHAWLTSSRSQRLQGDWRPTADATSLARGILESSGAPGDIARVFS